MHDLTLAATYCDRAAILHAGRIVADGPPADVFDRATLERVYGVAVQVIAHPQTGRPVIVAADGEGADAQREGASA
jgi:iron complex transport system ATP-binding protein